MKLTELLWFLIYRLLFRKFSQKRQIILLHSCRQCVKRVRSLKNAVSLDGITRRASRIEGIDRSSRLNEQFRSEGAITRGKINRAVPPKSSADLKVLRLGSRSFRRRLTLTPSLPSMYRPLESSSPRFRFVSSPRCRDDRLSIAWWKETEREHGCNKDE